MKTVPVDQKILDEVNKKWNEKREKQKQVIAKKGFEVIEDIDGGMLPLLDKTYGIKNFKSMPTTDWEAFNLVLTRGKREVIWVHNDGLGGCIRFDWKNRGEWDMFEEHVMSFPKYAEQKFERNDSYVFDIVADYQDVKYLNRKFKKTVMYALNGNIMETKWNIKKNHVESIKKEYTVEKLIEKVLKEHPDAQVLNTMPMSLALQYYQGDGLLDNWCPNDDCKAEFMSYPEDGECACGVHKHHVHNTCGAIHQVG